MVDHPAPEPSKLLEDWLQWEKGDLEPGRLIANLKKGGMKELLEELAASESSD